MSCRHCRGAQSVFNQRVAQGDLRRYRKKGAARTTRTLVDALLARGAVSGTLLDIGGGVGAVSNALLSAGVGTAVAVDASDAYLEAASEEAVRQGHRDRITYLHGDFVDLAERIAPADVVTLDRVICCYDDVVALVEESSQRARRLYGLVYPRDSWWNLIGVALVNLGLRLLGRPFRAFVHPTELVEQVAVGQGLVRRFRYQTPVWQVVVFERR